MRRLFRSEAKSPGRGPILTTTRKILLSLLGMGAVSAIIGTSMQGTRASFTASVINPSNTFATGTLTMSNSAGACTGVVASSCGALTFGASSMLLGTPVTTTVTITNAGDLPGLMKLNGQNAAGALAPQLNLTIEDQSGTGYCIYGRTGGAQAGACDDITNAAANTFAFNAALTNLPLPSYSAGVFNASGRWAAGEVHTYRITVEYAGGADGQTASIDFVWTGVQ